MNDRKIKNDKEETKIDNLKDMVNNFAFYYI